MTVKPVSRRLAVSAGLGALAASGILDAKDLRQTAFAAAPPATDDRKELFQDPDAPVLGNPFGTLPILEFFDYRCPYCRKMHPMMQRLLAEDHGIRYLAKEWPVFGGPSVIAAKIALAANWQGKFAAVNDALFLTIGALNDTNIRAATRRAGVDMNQLDHDLNTRSADLDRILAQVSAQAHALGLQGTPGFVIGTYLVPGAVQYDDLLKIVADARAEMSRGR